VQTLELGRYAEAMRASLQRLTASRYLPRLWEADASLWSADPKVQAAITHRLGWLRIAGVMAARTADITAFAAEIRAEGFTHALLLGMGGSGLFSEVCRKTFGPTAQEKQGHPERGGAESRDNRIGPGIDLTVLDTTDPAAIRAAQAQCPLKQLLIIVSSKSGATSEVSALSRHFSHAFEQAALPAAQHFIAITDAGTPLEAQATTQAYRRLFVHGPATGADVGGRFSALTYFGLVPAALMGLDIGQLLGRAQEMLVQCGPDQPLKTHPAAQLGAALAALADAGRDKLTLLCAPELASFGTWVEQLIAESTGKSGKGIAPFFGELIREASAYGPDRVFVELQLGSRLDRGVERAVQALRDAGHPLIRIHWQDAYDLGGEVMKWSMATAVTGGLMGIDPFDEPNVQESKDRTKALLQEHAKAKRFTAEAPSCFADEAVQVTGIGSAGPGGSLARCLGEWLQLLRPKDYVALLSFLPRTAALDAAVAALRARIGQQLGCATALGFGPRYLHSTGQLYKGGPDDAIFLLVTAEETEDLPIPGEPFTFGVLKYAQALGDFQAMRQKRRRVLHVHLRGAPDRSLARFAAALDEAMASVPARS